MTSNNGSLNTPRPALPVDWVNHPDLAGFTDYDKHYVFQVVQNLDALGFDKSLILLNFLACKKRNGV